MRKQIFYLSIAQVKARDEKIRTDSRQSCETFILRFVQHSTIWAYLFFSLVLGKREIGEEKREAERDGVFTCAKTGWELVNYM